MSYDLLKTSKALGDETRLALYHYLEKPHQEPVTVQQLAERFHLHPNAVRQHLAKLEGAGLVYSEAVRPSRSGRPYRVYRAKGPHRGTELLPRDYRLLSEILLEFIASSKISVDEIKAFGRRWGERLVQERIGQNGLERSTKEASRLLMEQFGAWGFEPQLASATDRRVDIRLHNCIFREVVNFHPELVCPLLHGVLEGLLKPFVGDQQTELDNGIAHGEETCRISVDFKS